MVNILPAAPLGTTAQMTPNRAADPSSLASGPREVYASEVASLQRLATRGGSMKQASIVRRPDGLLGAALAVLFSAALVAACGSSGGTTTVGAKDQITSTTQAGVQNDSTSASWLSVGSDKATAWQKGIADGQIAADAPNFPSVLSQPVDITAPGTYALQGGPVPSDANVMMASVSVPPDADASFTFHINLPAKLVVVNGQTDVSVTVTVTDVKAPYQGLRVWFL